ncbi:MAG: hypothetical protein GKS07_10400 [Nitrosopumilus sp.]|nr:MAG: hypothetical protein GKS07_10400 [Nitrosopumilus sp.]
MINFHFRCEITSYSSILSIILITTVGYVYVEIQTDKITYMMEDAVIVMGNVEIPKGNDPLIQVETMDSNVNRMGDVSLTHDEDIDILDSEIRKQNNIEKSKTRVYLK